MLLILADSGGSNGVRVRLWKWELQKLADETGLAICVSHLPPGTSKWNKIEHRLFSFISQNWRGQPLLTHATIVSLIGATQTTSIKKIRQEDAEEFIASLSLIHPDHINKGKDLADSSRFRHLSQAQKIFENAKEWGYLRTNPFKNIDLGKIRKREWYFITVPEFNALIDNTSNICWQALYGIMYWAGLRYGEAVNLFWNSRNLDFEKKRIYIFNRPGTKDYPPFHVKDYESRSIPMNDWICNILKILQSKADPDSPYIFISKNRLDFHLSF